MKLQYFTKYFSKKNLFKSVLPKPPLGGLKIQFPPPLEPPTTIVGGKSTPHPPVGVQDPHLAEIRPLKSGR